MADPPLPGDWHATTLGALGPLFRGSGGTRVDDDPEGLPCIRYGDLYTHHHFIVRSFVSYIAPASRLRYLRLASGDIVFAGSGETFEEIGRAAAYCGTGEAYAGADTIVFRPRSELDSRFAGYLVNGEAANRYKSRMGHGSSVIHISPRQVAELPVLLPPLNQQRRIAEILTTLDEAIEQTEALIAKTEQIKAGLMHDLFTRGVLPSGQLRPPREEAPKLYSKSALGCTPKTWSALALGSISTVVRGSTPRPAKDPRYFGGSFVPWITVGELSRDDWPYLTSTTSSLTEEGAQYSRWLPSGTVVLSNSGFGCGVPKILELNGCANDGVAAFLELSPGCNPLFLYYYLCSQTLTLRTRMARGVDQPNLNTEMLSDFLLPMPSLEEQALIGECLFSFTRRLRTEYDAISKLRQLKLGLMQDLLTGRVRVPMPDSEETSAGV